MLVYASNHQTQCVVCQCVALHVFTITHNTVRAVHQVHKTGVWCADTHFENTPPQLFHARTASFHHTQPSSKHNTTMWPCRALSSGGTAQPHHVTRCVQAAAQVYSMQLNTNTRVATPPSITSATPLPSSVSLHTTLSIMTCVLSSASHCVAPAPLQQSFLPQQQQRAPSHEV